MKKFAFASIIFLAITVIASSCATSRSRVGCPNNVGSITAPQPDSPVLAGL